jgi:hypothetical protein
VQPGGGGNEDRHIGLFSAIIEFLTGAPSGLCTTSTPTTVQSLIVSFAIPGSFPCSYVLW